MSNASLAIRIHQDNPNHHLWNNNGTWFIHYTLHLPDSSKRRVRDSLKTGFISEARRRRDRFLGRLRNVEGARREGSGSLASDGRDNRAASVGSVGARK